MSSEVRYFLEIYDDEPIQVVESTDQGFSETGLFSKTTVKYKLNYADVKHISLHRIEEITKEQYEEYLKL